MNAITNKTLTISDLTAAEKATLEVLKTAANMTEQQALAAIAVQREAVAKAVADATAKKGKTAKKVPEFSAPVYSLLKNCFKAEYKQTKTNLEKRIAELERQIPEQQAFIDALTATNDTLRERLSNEKLSEKQKEKAVEKMNHNTTEIGIYKSNLETFSNALKQAKAELATAEDKWHVAMPDFGTKPSYSDILAYFEHKESTQRANSGRTADSGKASKGQLLPKYNLNVAADIAAKVCQFLGIDIPADAPADTDSKGE